MTSVARVPERSRSLVIGGAIAALGWAASGVAALFSPTGDASDIGSTAFYIIEGTHALAETGIVVALLGLWSSRQWPVRTSGIAFMTAMGATGLLALITWLTVILAAAGVPADSMGEIATVFFLLALLGTLVGFTWLGIVVIRTPGVWWLLGALLIAYPLLLAVLLGFYATGLALGLLWAAVAWLGYAASIDRHRRQP